MQNFMMTFVEAEVDTETSLVKLLKVSNTIGKKMAEYPLTSDKMLRALGVV